MTILVELSPEELRSLPSRSQRNITKRVGLEHMTSTMPRDNGNSLHLQPLQPLHRLLRPGRREHGGQTTGRHYSDAIISGGASRTSEAPPPPPIPLGLTFTVKAARLGALSRSLCSPASRPGPPGCRGLSFRCVKFTARVCPPRRAPPRPAPAAARVGPTPPQRSPPQIDMVGPRLAARP